MALSHVAASRRAFFIVLGVAALLGGMASTGVFTGSQPAGVGGSGLEPRPGAPPAEAAPAATTDEAVPAAGPVTIKDVTYEELLGDPSLPADDARRCFSSGALLIGDSLTRELLRGFARTLDPRLVHRAMIKRLLELGWLHVHRRADDPAPRSRELNATSYVRSLDLVNYASFRYFDAKSVTPEVIDVALGGFPFASAVVLSIGLWDLVHFGRPPSATYNRTRMAALHAAARLLEAQSRPGASPGVQAWPRKVVVYVPHCIRNPEQLWPWKMHCAAPRRVEGYRAAAACAAADAIEQMAQSDPDAPVTIHVYDTCGWLQRTDVPPWHANRSAAGASRTFDGLHTRHALTGIIGGDFIRRFGDGGCGDAPLPKGAWANASHGLWGTDGLSPREAAAAVRARFDCSPFAEDKRSNPPQRPPPDPFATYAFATNRTQWRQCPMTSMTETDAALGWADEPACACFIADHQAYHDECRANMHALIPQLHRRLWPMPPSTVYDHLCTNWHHRASCARFPPTGLPVLDLAPGSPGFEEALVTACARPEVAGLCLLNLGARIGGGRWDTAAKVRAGYARLLNWTEEEAAAVCRTRDVCPDANSPERSAHAPQWCAAYADVRPTVLRMRQAARSPRQRRTMIGRRPLALDPQGTASKIRCDGQTRALMATCRKRFGTLGDGADGGASDSSAPPASAEPQRTAGNGADDAH